MKGQGGGIDEAALRRVAEGVLLSRGAEGAATPTPSGEDARRMLHDLQVHQVELQMQNEELLRSQVDLGAARARYFDLYDLAPVGYCTLDAGGLILEANLTAADLLGMARGELVGQPLERFIARSEQDNYYLQRRRPHPRYAKQVYEMLMLKADGRSFWAQLVESQLQGGPADGSRRVVLNDISERKRNEADRERLMAAVEQAGDSIVITDLEASIQYVNPAFEKATGYTRSECLGRNPRILKGGGQPAEFYLELWDTLLSGKAWTGRLENRRKDGTPFTEDATITPVFDKDENITNYVAVKRDVTERVAHEAQHLQAQKMEALGRLAAGVAHDFNNMLGVILALVKLELEAGRPGQTDGLEQIQKAAASSADMTGQLLAFARCQPMAPVVLDLNRTLEGLMKLLPRLLGKDVKLSWLSQPDLGFVKVDPSQLDQALVNLCINARDAMSGRGELRLEASNVTLQADDCLGLENVHPGDYVELRVTDDGCGMDPSTSQRVFEPFFTTKPPGQGTGLGLAMVYGMVTQSNGTIAVDSRPGLGSRFTIRLPRYSGEELPA
jgi:PAS domain S-box-containing protein